MNVDHRIRRHGFHELPIEEGNHRWQWKAIWGRWKVFFTAAIFCSLAWALPSRAAPPVTNDWRVWLEPRFMHQPVTAPIPQAQQTEIAGGRLEGATLQPLGKAEWAQLAQTWEQFSARARANADADLAALKPVYTRNRKKIIEYAELHSEQGLVASAVLAPGFLTLFEETLGPEVLVVVPNQSTAYIFPKLASNYRDYAPMVLRAFRETSHPVSLEVFSVSAQGMQAIGAYPDPSRER